MCVRACARGWREWRRHREEAFRAAESLLNAYVIRVVSGSEETFQEAFTYSIIREYVTLQSFQGLITKKVRGRDAARPPGRPPTH